MANPNPQAGTGRPLPKKEADIFRNVVKHYELEQYKKAIKQAENILKKFPNHGETLAMKGFTYNYMNKREESLLWLMLWLDMLGIGLLKSTDPTNELNQPWLVSRMRSILETEKVTVGSGLLNRLIGVASGDIRSCLNTLQFATTRARTIRLEDMTEDDDSVDISSELKGCLGGSALKDQRSDVAATVSMIFRKERDAKARTVDKVIAAVEVGVTNDSHFARESNTCLQHFQDNSRLLDCMLMTFPKCLTQILPWIVQNVVYGKENCAIGDDQVWRALEEAHIAEFVRSLPNQLEEVLEDGENMVSGGQLQRLQLVRLFCTGQDADVILLDECLSALDENPHREPGSIPERQDGDCYYTPFRNALDLR